MSISMSSVRRAAIGAVGATVTTGALLFGPVATAQAAPASVPTAGPAYVSSSWDHAPMPDWHHHHPLLRTLFWFWVLT